MNVDQFTHCTQLIADNLARIIEQRESLVGMGPGVLANPLFRQVVTAQERLLNATEELLGASARH